jgi:hypothetical protein
MKNKIIGLIICLVLIFPTFSFFISGRMFTFHDETQLANLHQYFKAMDLGQFPPRWAPDMHFTYGSPFLSFNYQLPYYLGYLGHLGGLPLTIIFNLLLALSVIIGAAGFYFLATSITGNILYGIFAAVLYSYTPYQAVDHFVRGTLGEVYALAIFPWLLLCIWFLLQKVVLKRILALAIVVALLIISHQPAALFGLPLIVFVFVSYSLVTRHWSFLKAILTALFLSLLLSAFYWIPVIFEAQYIVATSPFNYLNQFPFIRQLLYSTWTYSGANPFSSDTFSFQMGIVNLIVLSVAGITVGVGLFKKSKNNQDTWLIRLVTLTVFIVIFLMNIRSNFIWERISIFQSVQFPWRLLMFTTLFTSLLLPLLLKKIPSSWGRIVSLIGITLIIILNLSYFRPGKIVDYPDSYYLRRFLPTEVLLSGEKVSATYLLHAEDYVPLPATAVRPTSLPSSKLTAALSSTQIITIDPNPFSYQATILAAATEQITFHTFAYPGWQVKVDGYESAIVRDELGAITFSVSPGKHDLTITYQDTPLRLLSNIISLGSVVFITSYLIYQLILERVTPTTGSSKSPRKRH